MKKWKLKALAAAAALAVSGAASAAIQTSGTGNGELFFSIWDDASQTSYTRDLGINLSGFATGNTAGGSLGTTTPGFTLTFAPDATFAPWLSTRGAGFSQLKWNVAAMDGSGQNRYLTTASATPTLPPLTTGLNAFNDNPDIYIANVNNAGTHVGGDPAVNGSAVIAAADSPNGFAGAAVWSSNWGGAASFSNAALIGQSMFYYLLFGAATTSGAPGQDQFDNAFGASTWSLANDGTLTFASAADAAVIPLPAGVWLLLSGLLGLVTVARRKRPAAGTPVNLLAAA